MRFWDTSTIVPLLLTEPHTARCREWITEDPQAIVWWGTRVECASAIARKQREGSATDDIAAAAYGQLEALNREWSVFEPSDAVAQLACRLLRVHTLRAADSMQLAAAILASNNSPSSLQFVCLDRRLRDAAQREGFSLLPGQ